MKISLLRSKATATILSGIREKDLMKQAVGYLMAIEIVHRDRTMHPDAKATCLAYRRDGLKTHLMAYELKNKIMKDEEV